MIEDKAALDCVPRRVTKKACLLGDFAVGKTSLIRRFVEGRFDERYLSTIGVKVDRKVLEFAGAGGYASSTSCRTVLTLMVWDLAGGLDSGPAIPSYYRGAAGAVLVCDLTRADSLTGMIHHAAAFRATNPAASLVVAANKVDLIGERRMGSEVLERAAEDLNAGLFLTSAKTGEQVERLFEQLGRLLLSIPRGAGD